MTTMTTMTTTTHPRPTKEIPMTTATLMTDAELSRLGVRDDAGFGALATPRGALPLTAMSVDARVTGLVATIDVAQTFENTLAEPIEATYVFPLPDRAAATRFRMEVAGRVIEGVIDERAAARQAYDAAISAGHRAAITEEDRAGVFTLRVGNLMPRDVATVRLTLTGPLPVDDGEVTFRFPLVVAPRYIPGRELPGPQAGLGVAPDTDAVPDASRITPPVLLPGVPNPVRLSMRLAIDTAGVPVDNVRSSLPAVTEPTRGRARVIEVRPGERLDRDFIVRWSIGDAAVRTGLSWAPDPEGPGATFMLTLVPPRTAGPGRPRDVVFVVDHSGSMGGWKMVCARRAVARMVDTLGEHDRFAVLAFDTVVDQPTGLPSGLAAASDRHRFRAVEFLAGLEARGGTELAGPLRTAADLLAGGYDDRDRVLVLVTDGQVGNEDQILRELAPRLRATRVFTLGIDQAVNAAFLRRLAAAGGGACELCESEDRLDAVMDKVHRRIATPVVTELVLAASGLELDASTVAPRRLPALFAGAPVVISGRLARAPGAGGSIAVSGRSPAGSPWREVVPAPAEPAARGAGVTAAWARARIRDLEDRFAMGAGAAGDVDPAALEREIVATSKRFSVLSRFTAFLAVDRSEVVNPGGGQRQVVQPVELPAGWEAAPARGYGGGMPPMQSMAAPPMMPSAAAPMGAPPTIHAAAQGPWGGAPPQTRGPASPPPARRGGTMRLLAKKVAEQVRGRRAEAADEAAATEGAAGLDWAPYAARIRALADAFDAARAAGDGFALELALARLDELVADLTSVGAAQAAHRLDEIVKRLHGALGRGELAKAAADGARDLRAVAGGPAPAPAPTSTGRTFWK